MQTLVFPAFATYKKAEKRCALLKRPEKMLITIAPAFAQTNEILFAILNFSRNFQNQNF
jgi:hypothetical protein